MYTPNVELEKLSQYVPGDLQAERVDNWEKLSQYVPGDLQAERVDNWRN